MNYGALIGGRVTIEATGAPLPSISQTGNFRGNQSVVGIYNSAGQLIAQAGTDQDGRYLTSRALPPGSYYAKTFTVGTTIDEAFGNVPCLGDVCDVLSSTPIVVSPVVTEADFIKGGIDFALAVGGAIESTIVSATERPDYSRPGRLQRRGPTRLVCIHPDGRRRRKPRLAAGQLLCEDDGHTADAPAAVQRYRIGRARGL